MDLRTLMPDLFLSGQIDVADLTELKARGIRGVIVNRPDGEEPGQPHFKQIADEAEKLGLETRFIPITPGQFGENQIREFAQALCDLPRPILAFCRTGTRSATLWALAQREKLTADEIVNTAAQAGYDLDQLRPRLSEGE